MDGALARAARHLCQVSVRTVAKKAGLEQKDLRRYEKGDTTLTPGQIQDLTDALVHYGARFIPEDRRGGVGVRRKFTRTSVQMIDAWEDEGGPVGEDDV
ncbi:helix-turn-helix transcriptional regulator [Gordonia araii NBRC 100433]|nr:helix-turn-helix transcriptional regulator [Gordonia araii NBRC 100433]